MSTQITLPETGSARAVSKPDKSLGELVASATADLSTLVRKEIQLAKVELKTEAKNAAVGAGALGFAAFAGLMLLIFLSIALAFGFNKLYGGDHEGFGFLTVAAIYLVIAAVAGLIGLGRMKKVGAPEKTLTTVKDDVAFAKHPTSAPTRRAS